MEDPPEKMGKIRFELSDASADFAIGEVVHTQKQTSCCDGWEFLPSSVADHVFSAIPIISMERWLRVKFDMPPSSVRRRSFAHQVTIVVHSSIEAIFQNGLYYVGKVIVLVLISIVIVLAQRYWEMSCARTFLYSAFVLYWCCMFSTLVQLALVCASPSYMPQL